MTDDCAFKCVLSNIGYCEKTCYPECKYFDDCMICMQSGKYEDCINNRGANMSKKDPIYFIKQSEINNLAASNTSEKSRIGTLAEIVMRGNPFDLWDSQNVIGDAENIYHLSKEKDPFENVEGYKLQWRSFYDGWGEGRINMLSEFNKVAKGERGIERKVK